MMQKGIMGVAKLVGIKKNVTMHMAKHSVGEWIRESGISAIQAKAIFHHSSLLTSQSYLNHDDRHLTDEVLDKLARDFN